MKVYVHPSASKELERLDESAKEGFASIIDCIRQDTEISRAEYKKLSGMKKLFELRVKTESGLYRGLGGKLADGKALLVFFQKKTDKTPIRLLRLARKRLRDYS